MAIELRMPALSPTMEKGSLARWLVAEGDVIQSGDPIAEIETDKATMEVEALHGGCVQSLLVAEGTDDIAVGTAIILLADSDLKILSKEPVQSLPQESEQAGPVAAPAAAQAAVSQSPPQISVARQVNGVDATPLARRIAMVRGIELHGIKGTGDQGRILKSDLLPSRAPESLASEIESVPLHVAPDIPMTRIKMSAMRKTIARRLTEAKQNVPHFYLTVRCRIDDLLELRRKLNAEISDRGIKISVNDMLIKAMALALIEVPEANVQFAGEELYAFDRVDVALAVAIENGLVTPVLRGADAMTLSTIAQSSASLASRARAGKLLPEDYQGGTVSISNLGMYGIDEIIPVINPPHALILGIGAGIEMPWKTDAGVGLSTLLSATGSFDHRAIDGAVGARFMAAFRALVEQPIHILA